MNQTPQQWLDELLATSAQQWLLRLVAVVAPIGALTAAGAAGDHWWPFWVAVVVGLAVASAIRPDAHAGLLVLVIVVWFWMASVDNLDTPWLPVAAVFLLVFHTVTALNASVPPGGVIPAAVLVPWLARTVVVAVATVGMWVLVVLFDRREAPGNGVLTALALLIVAGTAVVVRGRSLGHPLPGLRRRDDPVEP